MWYGSPNYQGQSDIKSQGFYQWSTSEVTNFSYMYSLALTYGAPCAILHSSIKMLINDIP